MSDLDDEGVAAAFLVALVEDEARGQVRSLDDYRARYPGYEHVVEREYAAWFASTVEPTRAHDAKSPLDAGRYRVDGEVGRGGMGVVYRAYEDRLRRVLALKAVRRDGPRTASSRLVEEARITARLDHPGIVPVYELGFDDTDGAWFTMPLVRGRTFADVIASLHADGPPRYASESWRNALDALLRVCEAVSFAHSRSIYHRDLKPQNVMVGRFGEVYVMDWGLAHVGRDAHERALADGLPVLEDDGEPVGLTREGDVLGTPSYMPPEQVYGTVDAGVDVYAIGAMLYNLVAGHVPYGGDDTSPSSTEVLNAVLAGPPPPLARSAPNAPDELIAICERAMARDRDARYGSVEELRQDLRAHLDGRVVAAHERGPWAELRKWVGRNRALSAAGMFAVLALAIGLLVSLVQRERADREAQRASASFRDSVAAVQQMLSHVGNSELEFVPETAPIRRELLRDATVFFDRFLDEHPDDLELRAQAAKAWYRVSDIHSQLGEHDAAREATRRSLQIAERGLARAPDDRLLLQLEAQAHFQAGNDLSTLGRYEQGEPELLLAVERTERLLATGRDASALALAGTVRDALALALFRARRLDESERHALRSAELREELVERFGDAYLGQLGGPFGMLGGIYADRGDLPAALDQIRRCLDARRRHLDRDPDDPRARAKVAETLRNMSGLLHATGSSDEALACAAEAVELRRRNVDVTRDTVAPQRGLADALLQHARLIRNTGDLDRGHERAQQALATVVRGLEIDPRHAGLLAMMPLARRELHRYGMLRDDAAAVMANATALVDAGAERPSWRFEAACLFAEAAHYLEAPAATDADEIALRLLRELHAAGALPAAALADPRLDPLRERDGFPRPE